MSRRFLFDDPGARRALVRGLVLVCGILVMLDLVLHRHVEHPWESLFAFYALYGFAACVLLVLLAKEMRKLVMRGEDYYGPPDDAPGGDREAGGGDG
jgi:hypothetical protein